MNAQKEEGGQILVGLSQTIPEHITIDSKTLCNETKEVNDIRCIKSGDDPLSTASLNICQDCLKEWEEDYSNLSRVETVQCQCDRIETDEIYRCGKITSVHKARGLRHPKKKTITPICEDCYKWLLNRETTKISTSYEDAVPLYKKKKT